MPDPRARPHVSELHTNEAEHRRQLAKRVNVALASDGSNAMTQPLGLASFAVADLPDVTLWEGSLVYVPDASGGAVLAFSDGSAWRRVTDRAVVS